MLSPTKYSSPWSARGICARASRGLQLALGVLLMAAIFLGCTQDATRADFRALPKPEGGTILTLALLEGESGARMLAPTIGAVFARDIAGHTWQAIESQWPNHWGRGTPTMLENALYNDDLLAREQLFVAHEQRIWAIMNTPQEMFPVLMYSGDFGLTWQSASLPESIHEPKRAIVEQEDGLSELLVRESPNTIAASLRILHAGAQGFFLSNARHLWRMELDVNAHGVSIDWDPISLEGVDIFESASGTAIPAMLRNYIPAHPNRPYELLTVLHEDLMIYRRYQESDRWILVSTLPSVDRQLVEDPESEAVYIVTSDAIYRAHSAAEFWDRLDIGTHLGPGARYSAMVLYPQESAPAGFYLVLGTSRGGIWRSRNGGGAWEEVRGEDEDGRGISTIVASARHKRIWAATEGQGVLRSLDGGQNWQSDNRGLRATRVMDMALGADERLLVASDAGLFRLHGNMRENLWERLHARASSTVVLHPESRQILSGTFGGALVVIEADGRVREPRQITPPVGGQTRLTFLPSYLAQGDLSSSAVMKVEFHPNSPKIYAWTHQKGLWVSYDNAQSWVQLRLNSSFVSALQGATLVDFIVDHEERFFLVSHATGEVRASQIWSSDSEGGAWLAVSNDSEKVFHSAMDVSFSTAYAEGVLIKSHGNQVAYSTDLGHTWRPVEGPWKEGLIVAHAIDEKQLVVLSQMAQTTEVFSVTDISQGASAPYIHHLIASLRSALQRQGGAAQLAVKGRRYYLSSQSEIFAGLLPLSQNRVQEGMAIVVIICVLIGIAGGCFIFLKRSL